MSALHRLTAEHVIYHFGPDSAPVITVNSGDTLIIETRDAYDRFFAIDHNISRYLRKDHSHFSNPATGPIFVQGAVPGDGLDLTIEKITLGTHGYIAVIPGIGVFGDADIKPKIATFEICSNSLWFERRIRLPLRPMIGVIGVSPANEKIPTSQLGHHGGNLDCNDITTGAIVHLPVNVPGALFAIGDVHASMGFCEVYSGVNIDAEVHLQVLHVPDAGWKQPWFETANEVMTIGVKKTIEGAIRQAAISMVQLLMKNLDISYNEAIPIAGASADIRLGQASKFGTKVSAYAVFPKSAFGR